MRNVRYRRVSAALIAVAALVVLSSGTVTGSASASSTSKTITVGAVWPQSGPAEPEYDGYGQGAIARFDLANAQGGVGGSKIKVLSYDDESTPAGNLAGTRYMFQQANALTMVQSPLDPGNIGFIQQNPGDPVITYAAGYNGVSEPIKNLVPVDGRTIGTEFETADLKFMASKGVKKIAILTETNASGLGKTLAAYAPKLGIKVVYTNYNFGNVPTDYAPVASAMSAAGVQGVYAILATPIATAVYEAATQANEKFKAYDMIFAYNPALAKQAGSELQGVYTSTTLLPFTVTSNPEMKSFLSAMKKYEPKLQPDAASESGWIAADLVISGIESAQHSGKPITRATFLKGLLANPHFDAGGLYPPLKSLFDPSNCVYMVQLQNSSWHVISKTPICAPEATLG
jgi:branched-chain amino acid transport system substrate-binding protein